MSQAVVAASRPQPYRVAQWATGNVGTRALRAVIEHPALTLVGLYVYADAKAGRDAGELCGLPPVGFCTWHPAGHATGMSGGGPSVHLVEIADFVGQADPRLAMLLERSGDIPVRVNVVGGYAVPLHLG